MCIFSYISPVLLMPMKLENEKRYALFLACKDSEYVKKMYGGYFNVFLNALKDEGESWDLFRVVEGDFPVMEDLNKYDGFVISGSPYDAYENDCWILRLCFLIQTLDAMQKKVVGICFGHQVLCRALGGRVGKAYDGWDIGIRKVIMVEDSPKPYLNGSQEIQKTAMIIECHQDEVWEVPIGAQVLGFSEKTGVEVFCIGDHILGIQGHPEYTNDILCSLIDRLVNNNSIDGGFGEESKARLEESEADREFWEKMCKAFLKGEGSHGKERLA